jgi:hypothetical protein
MLLFKIPKLVENNYFNYLFEQPRPNKKTLDNNPPILYIITVLINTVETHSEENLWYRIFRPADWIALPAHGIQILLRKNIWHRSKRGQDD